MKNSTMLAPCTKVHDRVCQMCTKHGYIKIVVDSNKRRDELSIRYMTAKGVMAALM